MQATIKLFNHTEDYSLVKNWWEARGYPPMPSDMLSKYGFLGLIDEKPVACSWLYPMNETWGMILWTISSPEVSNKERSAAIDAIFGNLHELAREMKLKNIWCITHNTQFMKRLEKYGYATDKNPGYMLWGGL